MYKKKKKNEINKKFKIKVKKLTLSTHIIRSNWSHFSLYPESIFYIHGVDDKRADLNKLSINVGIRLDPTI